MHIDSPVCGDLDPEHVYPPMKYSYQPLLFLFAGVAAGTVLLWFLIGQFLGSTNDIAADLASRTAISRSNPVATQPLSADRQLKAELETQLALNTTTVPKRDAADSSENAAGVQSVATRSTAERADSDDDIVARKSIEQLEIELASGDGLQLDELADAVSEALPAEMEEASLPLLEAPIKPVSVPGVDVSLDLADHCRDRRADAARVGVLFRPGSSAIKGRSLSELDMIVEAARRCQPSFVVIETHPLSTVDGDKDLAERRADEIKYYLLQRGIDKSLMRFQDRS